MKIVRPYAIQPSDLTTSAVNADPVWSNATSYVTGNIVSYGRLRYEALQDNTDKQPDANPDEWLALGVNNVWAMFDDKRGTQTTATSPLEVTVPVSGYVDTVGFLNVDAAQITVTITGDGVPLYEETHSMNDDSVVNDYYEYFFEPLVRKIDLVLSGLPLGLDPVITATFVGEPTVSVGHMIVGHSRSIGETASASIGIVDYSRIIEDDFGITSIVERDYVRRGRFTVYVPANATDPVYNLVSSYRAKPVLTLAADDFGSTYNFGLLRDAEIELRYPTYSIMSLEVRGL